MPALSEPARRLLEHLNGAGGGGCPYVRLSQVVYGFSASFLTHSERARLTALLRVLERQGCVVIRRDWGTLGYGRPTWIEVTSRGAAEVEGATASGRSSPAASRRQALTPVACS